MKRYLRLLRPKHYIKNLLIFSPVFFGGALHSSTIFFNSLVAFVNFCFLASIIYILNDIHDVEKDRLHPIKCRRPIACGDISIKTAKIAVVVLGILVCVTQYCFLGLNVYGCMVLLTYLLINIFYSIVGFKNYVLIDVFILALGFVLRIMYGSICTEIQISSWLYLVVFFGALFMGFGKRRNELLICGEEARQVLSKYNINYLGKCLSSSMTLSIVFYSFWCLERDSSSNKQLFLFTIPIFAFILLRYSYDIESKQDGDPTYVILV